ncbi:MarR family transcriptional regulator [Dyella dinghuensis]|uniref:MarR family transcriptional regulator n=1 Tax=Dyella dinghuensis TaxID=1920169 RepID=A0A3S0WM58_9GAMM|nr:MarR family transcriptional regulator [Dyella dinghuensis]RUL61609.1 MarR family transcriptional regulator [Dyella dinghuensis]
MAVFDARPCARIGGRSYAAVNSAVLIEKRVAITYRRHPNFPRDISLLLRMIRKIARRVASDANVVLQTWAISHSEYMILMSLYGTEGYTLTTAALCDAMGESAGSFARLARPLVSKGLIVRGLHQRDRRKVTFNLTPEGLQLIDAFLPVVSALLDRLSQVLSQTELKELDGLLKKVLRECEM